MPRGSRSILAAATVALTLAAGSLAVRAQRAQPIEPSGARPTPIELAGAMTACLAPRSRSVLVATGGVGGADIEEGGEVTMVLYRRDGDPQMRAVEAEFWLDNDPVQPPVVLIFKRSTYEYAAELRRSAIDCFTREYHRLLRP